MKKVTEEWLKAAADDLQVIERICSDEALTHMVAFHCQQCVEKSLKAVIEEYELGSVRIHNLGRLFEMVREYISPEVESELVVMLDKLYIDARYPGDLGLLPDGKPTMGHAERFRTFSRDIHADIKSKLEKAGISELPVGDQCEGGIVG